MADLAPAFEENYRFQAFQGTLWNIIVHEKANIQMNRGSYMSVSDLFYLLSPAKRQQGIW